MGLVLAEMLYVGRQIENQNAVFQQGQNAALSIMEMVQCSQPATCWLVTQGSSVLLDLILVSATGKSGT